MLYQQAVEADPAYVVPYLRLADIYLARKDSAAAKAVLEKGKTSVDAAGQSELQAKLRRVG
ncbi:tetratricopeptide repeat protein [bacterium]|nr:MAG: tetratricopeptide repeat protein [bacterium]